MRGWARSRGSTLRFGMPSIVVSGVLVAGLLGLGGASILPASADNNNDAPLQQGGGFVGGGPKPSATPTQAPLQAGGGNLPGQKPTAPGDAEPAPAVSNADAAPAFDPGYVDRYAVLWKQIEADKKKIAKTVKSLSSARKTKSLSSYDLQTAFRERARADATLAMAQDKFGTSVRNLYINGTTDVDVVLGVLGSEPDDVLANIDSFIYLRSSTQSKTGEYVAAQQTSVATQSAAANAAIRAADDSDRVAELLAALTVGRKKLAKDQAELQALVAVAAPQTVISKDGCPKEVLLGSVPVDVDIKKLCKHAVKNAATPQAAIAIKWALIRLGAPYACEGIGRMEAWRFDCSSYVSRAYAEGAGLKTAGEGWAPSTRNMVPWDGVPLDPHYAPIAPADLRPGDLVLYDTCPAGQTCAYRHVVMYLGPMEKDGVPMMAHTNGCGLVAHVEPFTGTEVANFLGARRVVALKGEKIHELFATPKGAKPAKPAKPDKGKKPKSS